MRKPKNDQVADLKRDAGSGTIVVYHSCGAAMLRIPWGDFYFAKSREQAHLLADEVSKFLATMPLSGIGK